MNRFARLIVGASALIAVSANQAVAQEKPAAGTLRSEMKVLVDNEKLQASVETLKPGAESESRERPYRIVRALKGGIVQRIYPDGKKAVVKWKVGDVHVFEASGPYALKNIGDTEVVFYIVGLK